MRVVRLCERIEKELDLLLLILLVHVACEPIIAATNQLRCGLNRMLAQMLLQQLVCDTTAPELVGFCLIFWPWRFLAAQLDRRVALEINGLLQQLFYLRNPLVNPLRVQGINLVSRFQRAEKNIPRDRVAVFCGERVNVLLRKEKMAEIEQLQIAQEEFSRNFLIQLLAGILAFLEEAADGHGNRFLRRCYGRRRRSRGC